MVRRTRFQSDACGFSFTTQKQFLADIEAFLVRTKLPATTIGLEVMKDGSFVRDLRDGRMPRLDTIPKVYRWMLTYERAHADALQTARKKARKALRRTTD
jgi:hypothetical protein